MSLLRSVKSIFSPEILAEEIVHANEKTYHLLKKKYPGRKEHDYLAWTYVSRRDAHRALGADSITDEQLGVISYTETLTFAVLPPPQSIRALALYILFKERPDLITDLHRTEFGGLMEPVFKAQDEGEFEDWYARTNPETAD